MRGHVVLLTALLLVACGSEEPQPVPQAGTPEREQRDSVLGQSQLPGAGVVRQADAIRDSSRKRAAAIDSMRE
jgi:uncharacterized protein YcfL